MTLTGGADSIFQTTNRTYVERTIISMRPFFRRGRWLAKYNRYRSQVLEEINAGITSGTITNKRHMAQYISASALLHYADGWSYLGDAVVSCIKGNPRTAIHLAYYAELRATIAVLASQGIGIFIRRHVAIDDVNSAVLFPTKITQGPRSGTHVDAWAMLQRWASDPSSGKFFGEIVRPEQISLNEWLRPVGGGHVLWTTAREWMTQWGLDLRLSEEDKSLRNQSSYQPDGIPDIWATSFVDNIRFTIQSWEALEPTQGPGIKDIDRHLLRLLIEKTYQAVKGHKPNQQSLPYQNFIRLVIDARFEFTDIYKEELYKFFLRSEMADDLDIIRLSQIRPTVRSREGHLSIIARAILLLRIAGGSVSHLYRAAGIDLNELRFWWEKFGRSKGLWTDSAPEYFSDLWTDIEDVLADAREFYNVLYRGSGQAELYTNQASVLGPIGTFERVALWTL